MSLQCQWASIDWNPCALCIDDRVGLLVTADGTSWITQNGSRVAKTAYKLPVDKPLYPLVDLLGNTAGVTLIPDALPPMSFSRQLSARFVDVLEDGNVVRHRDVTGKELQGTAFCAVPIPLFDTGSFYFEVKIDDVCTGNMDGLTIGVTQMNPEEMDVRPACADEVPDSWTIGFDGQASCDGTMIRTGWNPDSLAIGDRIGFMIESTGHAWLVENGVPVCHLPVTIPLDKPLYPLVDLLGNTTQVSLIPTAHPPGSFGIVPFNTMSNWSGGKKVASGGGWNFMSGLTKLVAMKNKAFSAGLSGFDRHRASEWVSVSADGLTAVHTDADDQAMQGVLFGDAPVMRTTLKGRYFEVKVDRLRYGFPDGLVIGFTTAVPGTPSEPAVLHCADEVPHSWSFGYNGASVVVPEQGCTEPAEKPKIVKMRSHASLYRVSRFSSSAYRVSQGMTDTTDYGTDPEAADSSESESDKPRAWTPFAKSRIPGLRTNSRE